jgi:hypothetical protein
MSIDAELQEQIRVTKAAAAALAPEAPPARSLSVRDFLIGLEKAQALTAAHKTIIAATLKMDSIEGSAVIPLPITFFDDPDAWPETSAQGEIPAPSPPADSNFAQNAAVIAKAIETLSKAIEGRDGELAKGVREALAKATATEKLAEITKVFGIEIDPVEDDWSVRCQIGNLVSLLCQQVQLEGLLGTGVSTSKAASKPEDSAVVWPSDMSKAKFDRKRGFVEDSPTWGADSTR